MSASFRKKSLILFASGKGSNAAAIIAYFTQTGQAAVSLIVCNNPAAGVLDIARAHAIPFLLIDRDSLRGQLLIEQLKGFTPDLIILAGFLWKIPAHLIEAFPDKIINLHPALLPRHGGKGMYGIKVHESVIAAKDKKSGITIHYVNEHYDEGNHIVQVCCKVNLEDTALTVAGKVARLEHTFFPKTIEYLLDEQ